MQSFALNAILMLATIAFSTGTQAQTTYRCANSYSQTPCPGGVAIDATDARTPAQKAQADQASKRDARIAEAMEKARLQQEARDLADNTPPLKPAPPASASKSAKWKPTKTPHAKGPAKKKKTAKPISEDKSAAKP